MNQKLRVVLEVLIGIVVMAVFVGVFLLPVQRFWLHGPRTEAVVTIVGETGGRWRKPSSPVTEQTVYYYVVEMPDGSSEHVALPERLRVGSAVRIGFTRGSLTRAVFIDIVEPVTTRSPDEHARAARLEPAGAAQKTVDSELWELAPSETGVRWVIIHNLDQVEEDGLYHVEVLARRRGDPPWKFERLAAHMAATKDAFLESAVRPLDSGHVYPEHFHAAFEAWKKLDAEGRAPVCAENILACLQAEK